MSKNANKVVERITGAAPIKCRMLRSKAVVNKNKVLAKITGAAPIKCRMLHNFVCDEEE